jgi:hypothetical protein
MPHDSIFVVVAKRDNPIIAPEGSKEAYFQFCVRVLVDNSSATLGNFLGTINGVFAAAIDHVNVTVGSAPVRRSRCGTTLLKALREAADFVPSAEVSWQLDMRHRRKRSKVKPFGRCWGTASEQQPEDNQNSELHDAHDYRARKSRQPCLEHSIALFGFPMPCNGMLTEPPLDAVELAPQQHRLTCLV